MRGRDVFASCHPGVCLFWFCGALLPTMFCREPFCLLTSLLCAAGFSLYLAGWRALWGRLRWLLPMALLTALVNPLVNPRGETALFYLPWGPVTWESLLYGLSSGTMLLAVLLWFSAMEQALSGDRLMGLFRGRAPALTLALSMAARGVPRFIRRFREVREARLALGRDMGAGGFPQKLRAGASALSAVAVWSLENAVDTADSMKSRGYGLPGRTAFAPFRFTARDGVFLGLSALAFGGVLWAWAAGSFQFDFYPALVGPALTGRVLVGRALWGAYCLLPLCFCLICGFPQLWRLERGRRCE